VWRNVAAIAAADLIGRYDGGKTAAIVKPLQQVDA
jgi:hypothetical protein